MGSTGVGDLCDEETIRNGINFTCLGALKLCQRFIDEAHPLFTYWQYIFFFVHWILPSTLSCTLEDHQSSLFLTFLFQNTRWRGLVPRTSIVPSTDVQTRSSALSDPLKNFHTTVSPLKVVLRVNYCMVRMELRFTQLNKYDHSPIYKLRDHMKRTGERTRASFSSSIHS